ncbi:MAG: DUF1294 domain-containing protein [Clostridiales bacterium]|nr:DUF1294 domain-containing protein [Clostridiales bacterium]
MSAYHLAALVYLGLLALSSALLTICDKRAARRSRRRVPERTLLLFAAAGGAGAMYAVMRLIRHKTLHRKFMLGLPALLALHVALLVALHLLLL